ncbi:hypothetical protein QBC42DRAFT_284890 [Cladorrhinum samala]|uniref:C3H1-type domain-containing protein n=1 Tax=Cladorrhinum samala TaxID=585594 RepID=A0AAV9HVD0_9PEZI|nr:hypothetical protein QBC42DRAFT_284890 [Cladorrhinum samala]
MSPSPSALCGADAGKSGRYELPFRRCSNEEPGASDEPNHVRRGQLGATAVAHLAVPSRFPARFNTASRPISAANWRSKGFYGAPASVGVVGSSPSACETAAGTLGSSALGGFSASGTTQLGFCLASGAVAGFELGRGAPVSPRSSTSASGLSFVGSPVASGAGGGLIPTTPRGPHAGARRMELVLPDNAVGYCFVRPNGTRTRLIPADMLPFSLQGVPTMEPDNSNLVELPIPAGMSPDGKNTNTSRLSLLRGRNSDAIQSSYNASIPAASLAPSGQQKKIKVYCDKWVHEGVCAFTQQGCKYKHEMPFDRATQHSLGLFHGLPAWWKKAQQELATPVLAPSAEENYPVARGTTRLQAQQQQTTMMMRSAGPQQQHQQQHQQHHSPSSGFGGRVTNGSSSTTGFGTGWDRAAGAGGSKFVPESSMSTWWRRGPAPENSPVKETNQYEREWEAVPHHPATSGAPSRNAYNNNNNNTDNSFTTSTSPNTNQHIQQKNNNVANNSNDFGPVGSSRPLPRSAILPGRGGDGGGSQQRQSSISASPPTVIPRLFATANELQNSASNGGGTPTTTTTTSPEEAMGGVRLN